MCAHGYNIQQLEIKRLKDDKENTAHASFPPFLFILFAVAVAAVRAGVEGHMLLPPSPSQS